MLLQLEDFKGLLMIIILENPLEENTFIARFRVRTFITLKQRISYALFALNV